MRRENSLRRRVLPRLFAALALCLALPLVTNCDNSSDSSYALLLAQMAAQQQAQQQQQVQQPAPQTPVPAAPASSQQKQYMTFIGDVCGFAGAVPARVSALVQNDLQAAGASQDPAVAQSASPDLSAAEYEWFAQATSGEETVEGTFVEGSAVRAFEISLELGKTWNITCGIRVAGGGAHVMADSYPFTASVETPTISHSFAPEPVSEGSGSVVLKVALDSSLTGTLAVSKATAFCAADDWPAYDEATGLKEWPLTFEGTTATLTVPSVKRGCYDVAISFFAAGDVFLYSTVQTVNVLVNAKTDTWTLGGGEGRVEGGMLVVDADLVNSSSPTALYVGATGAPNAKAPSDSNAGGAYAPLEHLSKAAQIIEATAKSGSGKAYKIFVSGNVASSAAADNAAFSSALDGKASSITISGMSESAVIDAAGTGTALKVNTKVPITIKNLKITGGSAEKGGGILASGSGVKVTLASGAKLDGNSATESGGGAFVEGGAELCVDGGAVLSNKAASGGGVFVSADGSRLLLKGSPAVPYGGKDAEGKFVNDVYLAQKSDGSYSPVQVAAAFAPDVSQGKITINAQGWKRKQVVVKAAGSDLPDISFCEDYFEPMSSGINLSFGGTDKKVAKLTAPYYVASEDNGGEDSSSRAGTEDEPYKTLAFACEQMSGGDKETIYVKGTIDKDTIPASFAGGEKFDADKCSSLTIIGATALPASGIPQDTIDAGGSGTALTVNADSSKPVPITIENLMITGGNNSGGNGGGIYVAGGAKVTLKAGGVIAENEAFKGGGVYVDGNFTLDGGVIGDASKSEHATYSHYSNRATGGDNVGGGIFYSATGKVTIKSGIVAYNFAYRGGGIGSKNDSYTESSQLTIEGGKIRHNCSTGDYGGYKCFSYGGGVFVRGSKLSFTDGEIYGNYGVDGGGGLFLEQTSDAVMSGGTVHDNEYNNATGAWKNGADIVVFDSATLSMTGGRVYSSLANDYCVNVMTSTCSLKMSGSATIEKSAPVWLGRYEDGAVTQRTQITIAGALTPPDPADLSKKNAYIVPAEWKRGLQVLNAPASIPAAEQAALVAANIGRFATIDEEFDVKAKDAAGFISAPICVAALNHDGPGARRSPVNEGALGQKDWGAPSELASARGTRSEPFAKMSQAVAQMTDKTAPYEILINGTIKGSAYACAEFDGAKVGDVTIRGVNGDNSIDVLDADSLGEGSSSKIIVLSFNKDAATYSSKRISVKIQDLKITGANRLGRDYGANEGGGIGAYYCDISLGKGVLIAGNKAVYGGGVYVNNSNLYVYADACIGQDASGTATGTDVSAGECSNYASSAGGGLYCYKSNAYLGYKEDLSVAAGDDAWTGGIYRNCSYDGGGIRIGNGSQIQIAAGNISRNLATKEGGGIHIQSGENNAVISGGKIEENQSKATGLYEGGGGICNLCSLVVKDDAEILGNKANKGGGVYNGYSGGALFVLGGKIHDNTAGESGGAVYQVAGTFSMGGTAWIPYGGAEKKNDVYLYSDEYITIESALSLPTGVTSGANATITPNGWKRGTVIAQGKDGGTLPTGSENRLALAAAKDISGESDVWEIYRSSDNKEAKINAPIYVSPATLSPPGNDDNIGTHSAPYLTVTHALEDLNDPSQDYTIYIYGTVTDHVTINKSKTTHAKSLTIESGNFDLSGPGSALSGGCDASTDWSSAGRTLWVKGDVPVTIKGLKITGGKENANGGGILVDGGASLTLDEYCLVTENYATGFGAGIFVNDGGTLNIKGCIRVKDNKTVGYSDSSVQSDSNVYLPNGNVINVMGSLTRRIPGASSDPGNSEIHVTTGVAPSIDYTQTPPAVNTVTITYNYSYANNVHPSAYFTSDQNYGFASWNGDDEAALGVHGGSIVIEPTYKDLALSIDKTWAQKGNSDKITVSGTIDGQPMDFDDSTSANYTTLAFDVKTHGESAAGYYSKVGNNAVKFSGSNGKLPAGDYVLLVTGVHGGKTYSASFDIRIMENATVPAGYAITGGETVTGAVGTKSSSNVFIAGRSVAIPVIIACDHEVTQAEYEKYCCYDGTNRPSGSYGKGENYPVYYVNWCDAIVYCNLKSLADGLTPVYSLDGVTDPLMWKTSGNVTEGTGDYAGKYHVPGAMSTTVQNKWKNIVFDQSADGWRLPTEVEWEYLARAANKEDYGYSGSDTVGEVAWWSGNSSITREVKLEKTSGVNSANGLGLYDMSGNVYEWCWDWRASSISADTKYTGPDSGSEKVRRGGSYKETNSYSSVSNRDRSSLLYASDEQTGFRVVRTVR